MSSFQSATTPDRVEWKAATWAGLIAGAIFLMMEMILLVVVGESPWGPPRMMAAMIMGEGVLPPPGTSDLVVVMVAMIVHFVLSIALALAFAWAISLWHVSFGAALALGAGFGLLVYLVNFYPITAVLFPWFAMARNWITISSHIVFGIVLAWAYVHLTAKPFGYRPG
jgi:hypothetical protein